MIELIATLAGVLFGAIGVLIAVQQHIRTIQREFKAKLEDEKNKHSEATVKAYAAQRDFEHLERHLGQHREAIKLLQEDLEEMKENQIEVRILLKSIAGKVGGAS